MIDIVLDTNILHQEGLFSRNMQLLGRLAQSEQISIHVPELVKREYLSKRIAETSEKIQSMQTGLTDISKKLDRDNAIYSLINNTHSELERIASSISVAIENDFEKWQVVNMVEVLQVDPGKVGDVFNDYFNGGGVFRKPKSREDLPDAFINVCVQSLLAEKGKIDVVIKDGAFQKHLETVANIAVFETLGEFLETSKVSALFAALDAKSKQIGALKNLFYSPAFQTYLSAYLMKADDTIDNIYIEENTIDGVERIGIESCFGVSVNYPQAKSIREIHFGEVMQVSEGHFSIEISFISLASLHYCADYYEYTNLPAERKLAVEETGMNGDGISDLEEMREVFLSGHVELRFDPKLNAEQLTTHIEYLDTKRSQVNVEIEMNKAKIL